MHVKLQIVEFVFKLYLYLFRVDYVKTVDDQQCFVLCGEGTHFSYILYIFIE